MTDVHTKIKNGDYENKLPYPRKPSKPNGGTVLNAKDAAAFLKAFKAYDAALVDYHAAREAYSVENGQIYAQFKADVLAELGLTDHPKAEKLFSMAWGCGHSEGYDSAAEGYDSAVEDYAYLLV
jgi:hypothetical protein